MKPRPATERSPLDLMEEAVHLLRSTSLHTFGWYLIGVLPFLLGLLYFWTDMSWSALAAQHRAEASLGMALLFLWMKTAQAIFAGKLHARLAGREDDRITVARFLRITLYQAIVQPSKLFLLPVSALATLPLAWVSAFYENATVVGAGEGVRKFIQRCWRLAVFSPRQNHFALSVYLLLGLIVFLNLGLVVIFLPQLFKMFTGTESIFTRNQAGLFNTTFFAVVGALTYLVCDPLLKAIYVLRCFYADALKSGADLMAEVRALPRPVATLAASLALLFIFSFSSFAAPPSVPLETKTAQLDRAITETLKRPEFTWKLPRQPEEAKPSSKWPLVDSIKNFLKATERTITRLFRWLGDLLERLFAPRETPVHEKRPGGWQISSRGWMIALLVLLVVAAVALAMQAIRQYLAQRAAQAPAVVASPKVDLADESLTADALPVDEWLALAREHLRQGEVRLALRAFFLSGLAHLAAREILILARHKSNRDYQAELRRKARDQPPLLEAFGQNIAAVERVWYGRHEIDAEGLRQFETNLERIRAT